MNFVEFYLKYNLFIVYVYNPKLFNEGVKNH